MDQRSAIFSIFSKFLYNFVHFAGLFKSGPYLKRPTFGPLGSKLLKKIVDVSADLTPLNCELFLCDFIHILLNFDFSFFQCSCQSKTSMFQIMNIISFFLRFKIDQSELELSSQWELELINQSELDQDFKTSLYGKDCRELFWLEVSKYYFQPLRLAFLLSNFFGLNYLAWSVTVKFLPFILDSLMRNWRDRNEPWNSYLVSARFNHLKCNMSKRIDQNGRFKGPKVDVRRFLLSSLCDESS